MLILASHSATRKNLLTQAGLRFSIHGAAIDERALEAKARHNGAKASEVAMHLAEQKAASISRQFPKAWVIGADQTLALGSQLLHKPLNRADAATQLSLLAGKTHQLYAGIALVRNEQLLWSTVETAELTMRAFSSGERDAVLALEGDSILKSVGGYRLEGPSIQLFETVIGDYFSVLGLPLLPLLTALRQLAPELLSPEAVQ